MRITITLDPDVAEMLKREMHRRNQPMRTVVNELLRSALDVPIEPPAEPPPAPIPSHKSLR